MKKKKNWNQEETKRRQKETRKKKKERKINKRKKEKKGTKFSWKGMRKFTTKNEIEYKKEKTEKRPFSNMTLKKKKKKCQQESGN